MDKAAKHLSFQRQNQRCHAVGRYPKRCYQRYRRYSFNIDSRANTDDRENAILKVFLKVFNERVGYCADFPHIAHLELELDKRNQYMSFKDKFAELTQSTWEKERDAYDFYRDELSEALARASEQSLESAKAWVEQVENNFPLDIRNFCKWVNEYLDRTGDRNLLLSR